MPMSNFQYGFSGGVGIQGIPILNAYATSAGPANTTNPGVWWVDSTYGANGGDGSYYLPLATVAYALSIAKANDIIMVKPNHTETIAAATAVSTQGLSIVGLGVGSQRATFTFTTAATATFTVSVANVNFSNIIVISNFADVAAPFTTTTAKGLTLNGVEVRDTDATHNFLAIVQTATTDAAADGLTLLNCKQISSGLTANTAQLAIAANLDRLTVKGCVFNSLVAANSAFIYQATTTKILTNVDIGYNTFNILGANAATGILLITTATTHSGMLYNNYLTGSRAAASAILVTASSGFKFMENYYQTAADKSGILTPANV